MNALALTCQVNMTKNNQSLSFPSRGRGRIAKFQATRKIDERVRAEIKILNSSEQEVTSFDLDSLATMNLKQKSEGRLGLRFRLKKARETSLAQYRGRAMLGSAIEGFDEVGLGLFDCEPQNLQLFIDRIIGFMRGRKKARLAKPEPKKSLFMQKYAKKWDRERSKKSESKQVEQVQASEQRDVIPEESGLKEKTKNVEELTQPDLENRDVTDPSFVRNSRVHSNSAYFKKFDKIMRSQTKGSLSKMSKMERRRIEYEKIRRIKAKATEAPETKPRIQKKKEIRTPNGLFKKKNRSHSQIKKMVFSDLEKPKKVPIAHPNNSKLSLESQDQILMKSQEIKNKKKNAFCVMLNQAANPISAIHKKIIHQEKISAMNQAARRTIDEKKPQQSSLHSFFSSQPMKLKRNLEVASFQKKQKLQISCFHIETTKVHGAILLHVLPFLTETDRKSTSLVCKQWHSAVNSQKTSLQIPRGVLVSRLVKVLTRFGQVSRLSFLPGASLDFNMIRLPPFKRLTDLDISRCIIGSPDQVYKLVNKCDHLRSLKMPQHLCDLTLLRTLYKNGQVASAYFKSLKLKGYFRNKMTACVDADALSLFLRESPYLEKLQVTRADSRLFKNLKFQNIRLDCLRTLDLKELFVSSRQDWAILTRFLQTSLPALESLKISSVKFLCQPPQTEEFEGDFCDIVESKPKLSSLTLGQYATDSLVSKVRRSLIRRHNSRIKNLKIKSKFVTDEPLEEFLKEIEIRGGLDVAKCPKISGYCFECLGSAPERVRVSFDDYKLGCLRDTLLGLGFRDTRIFRAQV